MAGLKVVPIKVHPDGNLDLDDLEAKAAKHQDRLAAFMARLFFSTSLNRCLPGIRSLTHPPSVSLKQVFRMSVPLIPSFVDNCLMGFRHAKSSTTMADKSIWTVRVRLHGFDPFH